MNVKNLVSLFCHTTRLKIIYELTARTGKKHKIQPSYYILEPYRRIIGVEWWRKKVLIVPISWISSGFMKRIREKDSNFGWYFRKVGRVCFGAPGHSWSFVVQHLTFSTHKSRKFAFFIAIYFANNMTVLHKLSAFKTSLCLYLSKK